MQDRKSGKLERLLAGAYAFLPNGSFLQAERGLVSFGACFHKPRFPFDHYTLVYHLTSPSPLFAWGYEVSGVMLI